MRAAKGSSFPPDDASTADVTQSRSGAWIFLAGLALVMGLGLSGCQRIRDAIAPEPAAEPTEPLRVDAQRISTPDVSQISGAGDSDAADALRDLEAAIALSTISALTAGGATLDAASVATLAAIGGGDAESAAPGTLQAPGSVEGSEPSLGNNPTPNAGSLSELDPATHRMTQEVEVQGTLFAMASGTVAPTGTPTLPPSVLGRPPGASEAEAGCEIPRQPELWGMALPSGAGASESEAMRAAFGAMPVPLLRARYLGDAKIEPLVPSLGFDLRLRHDGDLPRINEGGDYNIAFYPAEGEDDVGRALRIDDEQGVMLLAVSHRETDGAGARIWGGDRAGFSVRQIPTLCRYVEIDDCGFELRAAPVEVKRGEASITLSPGTQGRLESDPPYDVHIVTSHARLWRGSLPCTDPSDWVLSYRIQRADG